MVVRCNSNSYEVVLALARTFHHRWFIAAVSTPRFIAESFHRNRFVAEPFHQLCFNVALCFCKNIYLDRLVIRCTLVCTEVCVLEIRQKVSLFTLTVQLKTSMWLVSVQLYLNTLKAAKFNFGFYIAGKKLYYYLFMNISLQCTK